MIDTRTWGSEQTFIRYFLAQREKRTNLSIRNIVPHVIFICSIISLIYIHFPGGTFIAREELYASFCGWVWFNLWTVYFYFLHKSLRRFESERLRLIYNCISHAFYCEVSERYFISPLNPAKFSWLILNTHNIAEASAFSWLT